MALALRTVGKSWLDDVISVVAGLVDGYLLDKNPTFNSLYWVLYLCII